MREEAPTSHGVEQLQRMGTPRAGPTDNHCNGNFVVGIVIADRIRKEAQRHQPVTRERPQRFERRWQHRPQPGDRGQKQQLDTAGAVVEVRSPGRADSRSDQLLGNPAEEVDVPRDRVPRHLVEVRVHAVTVVVPAFKHFDLVRS
ncbi:hypothetical protein D9M71_527820 [compost metagenome]